MTQAERIRRLNHVLEVQAGKAVRPYRADGYVNLLTRYGTAKDSSEAYRYVAEPAVPDEYLTQYYEGNGLFAKIIDTPAEEAVKHGFKMKDIVDTEVEEFYQEALDELDWDETAMTAIKWARLFGGSIAVLLVNDGGGLEDPLDWKNIKSIDDIRVYDRSVVQPDYASMYNYDPTDPFATRGSRLGMPEYYQVFSKYGYFTVHDSRCLVFQNGVLPENTTNSIYQLWGVPEYIRINKAIQDAELAHRSAPKLLERSVQPIYKMKDLASLLSTVEGEGNVLRRLQTIDTARGIMNSIVVDSEGEDYDFKSFTLTGISDAISASCSMLSAVTSIPQTVLFGQGVNGLNSTDDTSMENYYNFIERIQRRMLRSNLRYLLSIIFQAGLATGEIDEMPKIAVEFNPLWSLSESEQAALDQQKAQTQQVKAQTTQIYVDMQAIDPSEVRKKLADSEEYDVETLLDEFSEDDLESVMEQAAQQQEGMEGGMPGAEGQPDMEGGQPGAEGSPEDYQTTQQEKQPTEQPDEGNAPEAAPAATKLPQDMDDEEQEETEENTDSRTDGGPGSGNHGHKGVPGQVGGSAPSDESSGMSKTTRKHDVGLNELMALKAGSKLHLSDGTTYTVTDDGDERWLEGEDGSSYSLDFAAEATAFSESKKEALKGAKVTVPDTEVDEEGLKHYQSALSNAYAAESAQDFDDKYRQQTGEVWKSLDQETKDALTDYSGHTYDDINKALRSGGDSKYGDEIKKITDAIEKSEMQDDTVLYRGVSTEGFEKLMGMEYGSLSPEKLSELHGKTGKEQGFMSTSSTEGGVYYKGSKVQMEVLTPAGTKALYAEPFSAYNDNGGRKWNGESGQSTYSSEDETIVQRGSSLTVLSGEYDSAKGIYHIKAAITWQDDVSNQDSRSDGGPGSVGVIIIADGKVLCGTRSQDTDAGLIGGPGGHIEAGETPEQAAIRETQEEFGITPKELIPLGRGPQEPGSGLQPDLYLCTVYEGKIRCRDHEMSDPRFCSLQQLKDLGGSLFQPFADSLDCLKRELNVPFDEPGTPAKQKRHRLMNVDAFREALETAEDGGEGSGNWGHEGRLGEVGGSSKGGGVQNRITTENGHYTSFSKKKKAAAKQHKATASELKDLPEGTKITVVQADGSKVDVNWYVGKTNDGVKAIIADNDFIALEGDNDDTELIVQTLNETGCEIKASIPDEAKEPSVETSSDEHLVSNTRSHTELQEQFDESWKAERPGDYDAVYRDVTGQVWQSADDATKDALNGYTDEDYVDENEALRSGVSNPKYDEKIDRITEVIDQCEIKEDTILYRGCNDYAFKELFGVSEISETGEELVGRSGTDDGFLSCGSSAGKGATKEDFILEICAPAGTKAIYAEPFSEYGDGDGRSWDGAASQDSYSREFETIVQRGTSLTIISGGYDSSAEKYRYKAVITGQDYSTSKWKSSASDQ